MPPTAVQAFGDVHETLVSVLRRLGLGARWIDQRRPFQVSASVLNRGLGWGWSHGDPP